MATSQDALSEAKRFAQHAGQDSPEASVQTARLSEIFNCVKALIDAKNTEALTSLGRDSVFVFNIRAFLVHKEKDVRAICLRTYRYLATEPAFFQLLLNGKVDFLLIRSFETEGRTLERIEATKLIQHWVCSSPANFPKTLANALVALSCVDTDELKEMALDVLRCLSLANTQMLVWSGGLRVMVNSILDKNCKQVESITLTLMHLLNNPLLRVYIKPDVDFGKLFAVFTEIDSGIKESEHEALLKLAKRAIVSMSRAWHGLIFLASSGLKAMLRALNLPLKSYVKEAILETVRDMLTIASDSSQRTHNLLNNYLAMVIRLFIESNLIHSLTCLAFEKDMRLATRARSLLKNLTKAAADLLPDAPQFQLMLDKSAVSQVAELVNDIDTASRFRSPEDKARFLSNACDFVSFEHMTGAGSVNWVLSGIYKQHLINTVDDTTFAAHLVRSNVNREPARWDWDIIYEIVAGPINSIPRMRTAIKQKFLKNLLSYYFPSKRLFTNLEWHHSQFTKARVGYMAISLMLSMDEGSEILKTSYSENFFVSKKSFMDELADALDDEIGVLERTSAPLNRFFAPDMMRGSMMREFLKWIGLFTYSRNGRKLLKDYGLDTRLMKLATAEHLSPVLLPCLAYRNQTSKDFLSFAMQGRSQFVRKCAMEQLRSLYRAGIFDLSWAVRELVNQLYSPDRETVACALSVLEELCEDQINLNSFIATGPQALTTLGEAGKKFLIKFLSSVDGVNYLKHFQFIERELEAWAEQGNIDYARNIEKTIEVGLNSTRKATALTLTTPSTYQHTEVVEIAWIRKLPFSILLSLGSETSGSNRRLDTFAELADCSEVYLTSKYENDGNVGYEISDTDVASVCLLLGNYYLDSKGREVNMPEWVRCTDKDRQQKNTQDYLVEKDGVLFKFARVSTTRSVLIAVSYRVELLPKAPPTVVVPTHLYGELVKTEHGLSKLEESGQLQKLLGDLQSDTNALQKRAALWALGQAGCTDRGVESLDRLGAVDVLVSIAERSPTLSLRGTAYQALSNLARSRKGRQSLERRGWRCAEPLNASIAMPQDVTRFFSMPQEQYLGFWADHSSAAEQALLSIPLTESERDVFKCFMGLNHVVNRSASEQQLRTFRTQTPELFASAKLYYAVCLAVGIYNFKLQSRRIAHKLFEPSLKHPRLMSELDNLPQWP